MKYYRVPPMLDQEQFGKHKNDSFIVGELYTEAECKRKHIKTACLDTVNISKKKTCFMFGARFEIGKFGWNAY